MRYLIDGHNLIAKLPDIDLADPDDEAKLVLKLRGFVARTGKRVTVVFDGGIPGGFAPHLSSSQVTVKFASAERMNADEVLLSLMRKIKNVDVYTLVSSDSEIIDAARGYGIAVLRAEGFIEKLQKVGTPSAKIIPEKDEKVRLSPREVDEWLAIFNEPRPAKRKRR
ncbi:MAG: NYN domain-containing protein [Anaerolineales bacterium]